MEQLLFEFTKTSSNAWEKWSLSWLSVGHPFRLILQDKSTTSSVGICFWISVWRNGIAPFSVSKLSTSQTSLVPTRQVDDAQLRQLVRLQEADEQLHVIVIEVAICVAHTKETYPENSRRQSCPH